MKARNTARWVVLHADLNPQGIL